MRCVCVAIQQPLPSIGHSASETVRHGTSIDRKLNQQDDKDISSAEANVGFSIYAVLKRVVPSPFRTFSRISPWYSALYNPTCSPFLRCRLNVLIYIRLLKLYLFNHFGQSFHTIDCVQRRNQ
ncbi:unnamed protein product [Macrosiphum euphorbiae]|uniref:Uncharacterized protein n=1 Tax=Macrosiphum euphorbiae TaxID=13131 RepID=A0AAV0XKQ2_9HEMI|nr:unnamed protein product [Macrosiphum euphorbiae]